jgi:putative FmdB family regulatory protein
MPLYEYTCRACEHSFEALVSGAGASAVCCPECQSEDLDRLIGLPAKGRVAESQPTTNCRGDGPPCGAPWCGRRT